MSDSDLPPGGKILRYSFRERLAQGTLILSLFFTFVLFIVAHAV